MKITKQELKQKVDQLYDFYDDKYHNSGLVGLDSSGIVIVSVGSFIGQLRCGGIGAYVDSDWYPLAVHVAFSLRLIGHDKFAVIAEEMLLRVKTVDPFDRTLTDPIDDLFWEFVRDDFDEFLLKIDTSLYNWFIRQTQPPSPVA